MNKGGRAREREREKEKDHRPTDRHLLQSFPRGLFTRFKAALERWLTIVPFDTPEGRKRRGRRAGSRRRRSQGSLVARCVDFHGTRGQTRPRLLRLPQCRPSRSPPLRALPEGPLSSFCKVHYSAFVAADCHGDAPKLALSLSLSHTHT